MKKTKRVTTLTGYIVVESATCDICKRIYEGNEWGKSFDYEVQETHVSMKTGVSFPEGGHGDEITFDICPDCFVNRLIPALRGMGAEPTESEWEWG